MSNTKTCLSIALTGMAVLSAQAVAPSAPTVVRHEWRFDLDANPAPSGLGALAEVHSGEFASGWLAGLPELPGNAVGCWDLGVVGTISCDLSNVVPAGAALERVTVKITQWWNGGIYDFVAVGLPGAQSVSAVPDISQLGPLGAWVVDETVLTPAAGAKLDTLTITAGANGAIVDRVVVEASVVTLPPLVLDIQTDPVNPGSIQLSWDSALGAAIVESSSKLDASAGWVPLAATPQLSNGRYTVTTDAGDAAKFFRLKK